MIFSAHSLRGDISRFDTAEVTRKFQAIAEQPRPTPTAAATGPEISIPLTTVSEAGTFDAYLTIGFKGSSATQALVVDSGNSTLIVPYWEDIQTNPAYTALGTATEPWGCPAKIVKGPIVITTTSNTIYTIDDCVFYACTGGARTANFGLGCITPWSVSGWNLPAGIAAPMQAPLSYDTTNPFVEIQYAAAEDLHADNGQLTVDSQSILTLYRSKPAGYTILNIIKDLEWMSVRPQSFSVGSTTTPWPGPDKAIAMVDTGGGPVYLSDPDGYVYKSVWPDPVACPDWSQSSTNCTCTSDKIGMTLTDGVNSYSFTIDTTGLPTSVQGLTAVMCEKNAYMMEQYGMNIGGISALFNDLLIDYRNAQVGFMAR